MIKETKGGTPKVLCGLLKNPDMVQKYNQEAISLTVALKMKPCTKHITIKYHHFHNFVTKGDLDMTNVDTKEHITDI